MNFTKPEGMQMKFRATFAPPPPHSVGKEILMRVVSFSSKIHSTPALGVSDYRLPVVFNSRPRCYFSKLILQFDLKPP